ncbi:NRAMP (natural resistance-associated macrophage protein)-like metal ion transporter [Cellulophaga sp. RHA_52]|uniref:Nramp family divalent metal transporter n=1 Tax=Cellulophaga sp. RHA_52 TaxID=1250036 RepID=UPI001199B717|nr:Nramp family divalent metal transporter [Cellulophaga sp. RHA_52]TVZ09835.1 NRAMP (natural resistance-associated macrophage protein)-like metal ion transporter [Cellulophaga sp. RHA_52]
MIKKWFKNIGPGPLIAAAFIGPGTITVCTLAGVYFGFALLWAMVLSIVATIVLQEMSARVGIVSQKGLSKIIRTEIKNPIVKWFTIVLILSAIVIGNAVYEAGNISGGILGLEAILGDSYVNVGSFSFNYLSILIGVIAFVLLFIGNYKVLEKALISLVIAMSLAFLITAIITKPNIAAIFSGIFKPTLPKDGILTVIALIGTTVVPYNLFLHASLVSEKWKSVTDLQYARKDTIVAVILGGIVSMCVIISAAAIQGSDINSAADLAKGLEPLFGSFAKYFLAIGLFAAGITSAITAPLAVAYVTCGCLGWSTNLKSSKFRVVWMFILFLGVLFSSLGIKPIDIIKFAQIANGILLPIIAAFLLWIMNKESVLGVYKNNIKQNILGFIILAISILLSVATLNKVFSLNLF